MKGPGAITAKQALLLDERGKRAEYMDNIFTSNNITPLTVDERSALIYQGQLPDREGFENTVANEYYYSRLNYYNRTNTPRSVVNQMYVPKQENGRSIKSWWWLPFIIFIAIMLLIFGIVLMVAAKWAYSWVFLLVGGIILVFGIIAAIIYYFY